MRVGINCGHTVIGPGSGAVGIINESKETRNVGRKVMQILREKGIDVVDCTIDKASSQKDCLRKITEQANRTDLDYFISIHFNAGKGRGVECYTYKGRQFTDALEMCDFISQKGFTNRGVKNGTGLYVVGHTSAKAILVECCFVDSDDAHRYLEVGSYTIADAIAKSLYNNIKKVEEGKFNMKKIVTYKGDIDALAALIVAQKHNCPLIKEEDLEEAGIVASEIIRVGGNESDKNRFETFKNAAKLL